MGPAAAGVEYVHVLTRFSQGSAGVSFVLRTWKYVDGVAFVRMLHGVLPYPLGWLVLAACLAVALPFLVRAWWNFAKGEEDRRLLLWAGTLTWTLVLNLYVGIYDTILALLGAWLMVDVLYRRTRGGVLPATFKVLLVFLYLVPWFSQHLAEVTGFQPLTVVLGIVGAYQLVQAQLECPGKPGGVIRG